MKGLFDHFAFSSLDKSAFESDIYASHFAGRQIEIMGASPYINARDAGIELCLSKKHQIEAIHFFNGTMDGFCRYQDALPGNVTFDWTRDQVKTAFGTPALSGDAGGVGIMALSHSFDRFETDNVYIRFEYEVVGDLVRLVTIGLM
jgi:hypothetical protein